MASKKNLVSKNLEDCLCSVLYLQNKTCVLKTNFTFCRNRRFSNLQNRTKTYPFLWRILNTFFLIPRFIDYRFVAYSRWWISCDSPKFVSLPLTFKISRASPLFVFPWIPQQIEYSESLKGGLQILDSPWPFFSLSSACFTI